MGIRAILTGFILALAVGACASPDRLRGPDVPPECRVAPHAASPAPHRPVTHLAEAEAVAKALAARFGASRVLVVFDIDNTLLTATTDFGSDAWFEWQTALLNRPACAELRVGDDFAGLLEVQYLAYAAGHMRATEADGPGMVARLAADGHPVVALTARGPEIRSATLRELAEAGYTFPTAPACDPAVRGPTVCTARIRVGAQDLRALARTTLSESERSRLPDPPRPVSYADGVMMVSGQDKGVMLKLLLASTRPGVRAIVFVDDGAGNISNVERAFPDGGMPHAEALWYTAFEAADNAFLGDPRRLQAAAAAWRTLGATLCSTLGRFCTP